ncbi:MAG TPA: VOC family protein [Candidatus Acidoferrales bacterium]|nr:VOC family protein [Candidatus Acidoferrales bacterium]
MVKQMIVVLAGLAVTAGLALAQPKSNTEANMIHVKRITPVLYVEEIEPCLKFWTERMGFANAAQVPDGNKIGFVMLQKDGTEIMYQTFASQEKDAPAIAQMARKGPTFLFIEVEKLDPIIAAMKGVALALPERKTFYGSREIGVKDPAGHFIIFAEFPPKPQS